MIMIKLFYYIIISIFTRYLDGTKWYKNKKCNLFVFNC